MVVRKEIQQATPGEIEPWVMLGFLGGCIENRRKITIQDWNDAVEAAARAHKRTEEIEAAVRAKRSSSIE